MAWITADDIKVFIADWDAYGFTQAQIDGAIANAEARIKDRLAPYFTLPADTDTPPAGLKSLIAQYAAYLLMRARRVALTEAEEAWVKELGKEVEDTMEKIQSGKLTLQGLSKRMIDGGESPSQVNQALDPLSPPFPKERENL